MTMPLASHVFDEKTAHPLRALPRVSGEGRSRAGVALVTILIHLGAVIAFIVGVRVAAPVLAPPALMVHLEAPKKEKLDLSTPPPALARPTIVTVPPPEVEIQAAPRAMAASPPMTEALPTAIAAPVVHGRSEGRDSFLGRLLAQLNRFKHYPPEARRAHIEGMVMLHFVMDESGHVTRAEIEKSSGCPALDKEALALIERAQPLPTLPADFPTRTLDAVVPIEFSLRG